MASKWITAAPGIRYRQHNRRKHGARLDRYFTLRFSVDGKQVEEALGRASEGWTLALAQEELSKLRKAKRTGEGPSSSGPRRKRPWRADRRPLRTCGTATARRLLRSRTGRARLPRRRECGDDASTPR